MSKIVFFGNERLIQGLKHTDLPLLNGLLAAGHEILAIVAHNATGQSRNSRPLEVAEFAREHNIPLLLPENPMDIYDDLKKLGADIGVLAAYGKIVPQQVIDLFPAGIANIHPSLLPKYRGPTPIETAIANGDNKTGVSLMALSAQMDAGPIYVQTEVAIENNGTSPTLCKKLSTVGAKMMINNIDDIVGSGLKPSAQDESFATYCSLLTKTDGLLDPKTMSAIECERKIRAFSAFPRTRLDFQGQDTIITAANVLNNYAGEKWPDVIPCADNTALQITEIVSPKSGKTIPVKDYLNGLK